MRVAVIGATGTIGKPLVAALVAAGHEVVAVARRADGGDVEHVSRVAADATDAAAIARALVGAEVVYHLVHSLGSADFEAARSRGGTCGGRRRRRGRGADRSCTSAASASERDDLSPHLRSRARDRGDARGRARPGDDAPRRDDRRRGQRGVRDDPRTRRPAAGDGLPAVGLGRDPARRARRRRARRSSRVCGKEATYGADVRPRRPGGDGVSSDDGAGRAHCAGSVRS